MNFLIVALVLLTLLFIVYVLYMRKEVDKMKGSMDNAILDMRALLQRELEQRDRNMAKVELSFANEGEMTRLRHEKEDALSEKESALSAKAEAERALEEALAAQQLALAAQQKAVEERDAALASLAQMNQIVEEKDAALAEKDKDLVEKDMTIAEREKALAEKESDLAEKETALAQKDTTLARKDAMLAEKDAELEALKHELLAASTIQEPVSEVASEPAPEGTEMRRENIRLMRRMLIRKMETAHAVLELKGLKKGEIIAADEWKDLEDFLEKVDNRFISRFKEKFPTMNKKDMELMMLLRLKIPSKNIASIYGINEKSVKQKLFIYKGKVGMESDPTSLRDFVEEF